MGYEVLYSEVQPCVLIACNCSPGQPFLLLIRGINQIVSCALCKSDYVIESVVYDTTKPTDLNAPPTAQLRIKRVPETRPQPHAPNHTMH
jgi:hypothetical protein